MTDATRSLSPTLTPLVKSPCLVMPVPPENPGIGAHEVPAGKLGAMRRRLLLVLVLCAAAMPAGAAPPAVEDFVARHWRAPLAPQGPAPARFSPIEASLAPEACGTCHPAQLADWRTSVHARAMGPGVAGQLVEMMKTEPG